jgi:hypothetical protein
MLAGFQSEPGTLGLVVKADHLLQDGKDTAFLFPFLLFAVEFLVEVLEDVFAADLSRAEPFG